MAKSSKINTAVLATLLAIAAGWATWMLFWPFGLAVYVPFLAMASLHGRKPAIACVVLSPFLAIPAIFAGLGAHAFLQGTAVIMVRGVQTVESTNLEPRHRVPLIHAPLNVDVRHGFGWLAYEGGVRLMGSIAGPMRGAYTGPYPGRVQAWRSLDAAKDVRVEGTQMLVGTRYATLPPELQEILLSEPHPDDPARAPLRAHRVGETILIGRPDQLWLVREQTGKVFATWRRAPDKPPRLNWPNKASVPSQPATPAPAVAREPRPYASSAY